LNSSLAASSFCNVMLLCFWTAFVAELVGDKSIYSIASLSLRFRAGVVFTGITLAFAAKMLVAVLLASVLVRLHFWTDFLSAVAFFLSAVFLWLKEPDSMQVPKAINQSWSRGITVCFLALFLTEWGDPSQIAVAALSVKSHSLLAPWLGGTLAMAAKGALAVAVGVKLRDRLPANSVRIIATASFVLLGILALHSLIHG
jgi:putative Ca2+/H+ antiporter (TMEM165/GDT1 family)